eukprot:349909-Chlamydomonas_euryale.AAC.2
MKSAHDLQGINEEIVPPPHTHTCSDLCALYQDYISHLQLAHIYWSDALAAPMGSPCRIFSAPSHEGDRLMAPLLCQMEALVGGWVYRRLGGREPTLQERSRGEGAGRGGCEGRVEDVQPACWDFHARCSHSSSCARGEEEKTGGMHTLPHFQLYKVGRRESAAPRGAV